MPYQKQLDDLVQRKEFGEEFNVYRELGTIFGLTEGAINFLMMNLQKNT